MSGRPTALPQTYPPPEIRPDKRAYKPFVSLDKALLNPNFSGGMSRGGWLTSHDIYEWKGNSFAILDYPCQISVCIMDGWLIWATEKSQWNTGG